MKDKKKNKNPFTKTDEKDGTQPISLSPELKDKEPKEKKKRAMKIISSVLASKMKGKGC